MRAGLSKRCDWGWIDADSIIIVFKNWITPFQKWQCTVLGKWIERRLYSFNVEGCIRYIRVLFDKSDDEDIICNIWHRWKGAVSLWIEGDFVLIMAIWTEAQVKWIKSDFKYINLLAKRQRWCALRIITSLKNLIIYIGTNLCFPTSLASDAAMMRQYSVLLVYFIKILISEVFALNSFEKYYMGDFKLICNA